MAKKIILSLSAEKERLAILEFYFKETGSKQVPTIIFKQINKAIDNISLFPTSGRLIDNQNHRIFVSPPYKIVYRIQEKEIIILHIWDSRRNPDDLKI